MVCFQSVAFLFDFVTIFNLSAGRIQIFLQSTYTVVIVRKIENAALRVLLGELLMHTSVPQLETLAHRPMTDPKKGFVGRVEVLPAVLTLSRVAGVARKGAHHVVFPGQLGRCCSARRVTVVNLKPQHPSLA